MTMHPSLRNREEILYRDGFSGVSSRSSAYTLITLRSSATFNPIGSLKYEDAKSILQVMRDDRRTTALVRLFQSPWRIGAEGRPSARHGKYVRDNLKASLIVFGNLIFSIASLAVAICFA